jgi:hypothetical protein
MEKKGNEVMVKEVSNGRGAVLENPTFIKLIKNLSPNDQAE